MSTTTSPTQSPTQVLHEDMLSMACRIHTEFTITRYLMSNAEGSWSGSEKATRHAELCKFYVAIAKGCSDPEIVRRQHEDVYKAVHRATQELTDNLDEVIGFPLTGKPDFQKLVPLFFNHFPFDRDAHALRARAIQVSGALTMWLLIDDERNLNTEAVARNAASGKRMLEAGGWECVCFDHDLGEGESGYDVLVWGLEKGLIPDRVQLVTSNPVGRKNMRAALEAAGFNTIDGINFYRNPVGR